MHSLARDLRFAWRLLLRSPGFAFIAVLCLALGMGATTAVFTVVDAVLFRPLPYKDPDRLVRIYTEFPDVSQRRAAAIPCLPAGVPRNARDLALLRARGRLAGRSREPHYGQGAGARHLHLRQRHAVREPGDFSAAGPLDWRG